MARKTRLVLLATLAVALLAGPTLAAGQGRVAIGELRVITSTIGDFDCFGYGPPSVAPVNPASPCGTLPGPPIADIDDPPNTDVSLNCSAGTTFSFTHTLDIPAGATILGGVVVLNVGGIQTALYSTTITADVVPALSVPDTGELGTGLVVIPLLGTSTSLLSDGQVVVTVRHGATVPVAKCDPVFVDFSSVIVLVHVAP